MVVIRIHSLNGELKRRNVSLWLRSNLLSKDLVEVEQVVHADSEVVVSLSCIALELLPDNLQ